MAASVGLRPEAKSPSNKNRTCTKNSRSSLRPSPRPAFVTTRTSWTALRYDQEREGEVRVGGRTDLKDSDALRREGASARGTNRPTWRRRMGEGSRAGAGGGGGGGVARRWATFTWLAASVGLRPEARSPSKRRRRGGAVRGASRPTCWTAQRRDGERGAREVQ